MDKVRKDAVHKSKSNKKIFEKRKTSFRWHFSFLLRVSPHMCCLHTNATFIHAIVFYSNILLHRTQPPLRVTVLHFFAHFSSPSATKRNLHNDVRHFLGNHFFRLNFRLHEHSNKMKEKKTEKTREWSRTNIIFLSINFYFSQMFSLRISVKLWEVKLLGYFSFPLSMMNIRPKMHHVNWEKSAEWIGKNAIDFISASLFYERQSFPTSNYD